MSKKPNPLTSLLQPKSHAATPIPPGMQEKMAAFAAAKRGPTSGLDATTAALQRATLSSPVDAPNLRPANSYPTSRPRGGGMMGRRKPNFTLKDIEGAGGAAGAGLGAGRPPLRNDAAPAFSNFSKIVYVVLAFRPPLSELRSSRDLSGALNFSGKAVLHADGVDFSNGASFQINMTQLQLDEELGKGNYGTVKKVLHRPTNVFMAMKEIPLELSPSKLDGIIMELDILHRAVAPEIVEFYGAFTIESCVYYCMEYMDAGSLDKVLGIKTIQQGGGWVGELGEGTPEEELGRIAASMVRGLKFLKDNLQIMHRDVKPTNVLVNRKGQIKLCDFGVSGQLDNSIAKTNIGCQTYFAPERIQGTTANADAQEAFNTYTVSSDVWSLGLSIIETALGRYPYPPETYNNVFAQLQAIVHGEPPQLPEFKPKTETDPVEVHFSEDARDWVRICLIKDPAQRATYADLLAHPFLVQDSERDVNMAVWVAGALGRRELQGRLRRQVLDADLANEPVSV
ncbi:Protein kinase domain-containing protein [Mycena chlorophos]|uniref:mitogen-activated protein kinase kinase n=1 Tax=Mycena chlorophos TaxID=658473 RepID=A0A8H6RXG6_MYCCL|nr:Protein kinase domain-containing protein [Mycena chlorophos]